MKKTILLAFVTFAFFACDPTENTVEGHGNESENTEEVVVGADKDAHGCLTASGESWSELQQKCIQVFNVAERLNPVDMSAGEVVFSVFVLFNEDQSKVELFLPENQATFILNPTDDKVFENGKYKFVAAENALYIDGIKEYDQSL